MQKNLTTRINKNSARAEESAAILDNLNQIQAIKENQIRQSESNYFLYNFSSTKTNFKIKSGIGPKKLEI